MRQHSRWAPRKACQRWRDHRRPLASYKCHEESASPQLPAGWSNSVPLPTKAKHKLICYKKAKNRIHLNSTGFDFGTLTSSFPSTCQNESMLTLIGKGVTRLLISPLLTLMHASPAADRTAVVIREHCVLVWETDGPDERRLLHATPILFLQFDQNWRTDIVLWNKHRQQSAV